MTAEQFAISLAGQDTRLGNWKPLMLGILKRFKSKKNRICALQKEKSFWLEFHTCYTDLDWSYFTDAIQAVIDYIEKGENT